ncbi:hypothetical protein Tco_0818225 [Tanacetum coccineum]
MARGRLCIAHDDDDDNIEDGEQVVKYSRKFEAKLTTMKQLWKRVSTSTILICRWIQGMCWLQRGNWTWDISELHGRNLASRMFPLPRVQMSYGPFGSNEDDNGYDDDHFHHFKYELDKQSFGGFHGAIYNNQVYTMGVFIKPTDSLGGSLKK